MRPFLFFAFLLVASPGYAESPGFEQEEPASEAELQAADIADHAKMMAELEDKAKIKANKRKTKLDEAQQKRTGDIDKFSQLSEEEQKRKAKQADRWARQGQRAYDKQRNKAAESSFNRALKLNPNESSYYYLYGVALYRNEKFEDALINLKLGEDDKNKIENNYYQGLIYLRLMEYWEGALKFKMVREANMDVFSANAAFYEGVIQYTLQNYTQAQAAFEWVLDNSKDPQLDKKADEFLEQIAQALQMKKFLAKKWNISATVGINYDSNILFSPDNDAATAVVADDGGGRALLQGKVERKLKRKKDSDFSLILDTLYMYSFSSDFGRADPWLTSFGLNYNTRGQTMRSKAYQYSFEPRGEILYMDANDDGTREKILTSVVLDNDFTIIQRDDYFAAYGIEVRLDNSSLDASSEDENSDAFKYILSTTHTWFQDDSMKQAIAAKIEYSANDAKGKEKNFNRIKAGVTYMSSTKSGNPWTLGVSAYKLTYPESNEDRRDTNVALDYSYTKIKNASWAYTGVASYASNTSSVDDNQYTRFSLMALATYSWSD